MNDLTVFVRVPLTLSALLDHTTRVSYGPLPSRHSQDWTRGDTTSVPVLTEDDGFVGCTGRTGNRTPGVNGHQFSRPGFPGKNVSPGVKSLILPSILGYRERGKYFTSSEPGSCRNRSCTLTERGCLPTANRRTDHEGAALRVHV